MLEIQKKVKMINIYKNALITNKHHNRTYLVNKYMEIEFFNGNIIRINMVAKADITNCDYLVIEDKGKLVKTLFKNALA